MEGQGKPDHEKRHDTRVPVEKLPDSVRNLKVSFGDGGEKFNVKTIDASVSGISFRIDMPVYSIQDYELTITADDASFTLHDELVYAKPLDQATSRVSVHFTTQPGLEKYQQLIDGTRDQ